MGRIDQSNWWADLVADTADGPAQDPEAGRGCLLGAPGQPDEMSRQADEMTAVGVSGGKSPIIALRGPHKAPLENMLPVSVSEVASETGIDDDYAEGLGVAKMSLLY